MNVNIIKETDDFGIKGYLTIKEINKETHEEFVVIDDNNVVTLEGYSEIFKRLYNNQDMTGHLDSIQLGSDVGSGTAIEPEPATDSLTSSDQLVTFIVPYNDINFAFPSQREMVLSVILDGSFILDGGNVDGEVRYSSATIRFGNDKTLSYKRFPLRTITPLIDIEISWRLYFT